MTKQQLKNYATAVFLRRGLVVLGCVRFQLIDNIFTAWKSEYAHLQILALTR